MPKIDEKKTPTNLVYYYKFSRLTTHSELDPWFTDFLDSADNLIHITRIRLNNLYRRHSEDGNAAELSLPEAYKGILQPMRNAHANRLAVYFTYQNAPMVMGLTLGEWEVSLSAQRSDGDKLAELSGLLKLDQA